MEIGTRWGVTVHLFQLVVERLSPGLILKYVFRFLK